MYVINDKELIENVEDLLEEQGCVDVEVDDMRLRYVKRENKVVTILMRINKLSRFIHSEETRDYHKPCITLVIPEGIDVVDALFYNWVGGAVDVNGRLIDRVSLPSTCEELSDRAFYGCYNLERIQWNNLKKIGYRALLHTRIRSCEIPENIEIDSQVCSNFDNARKAGEKAADKGELIIQTLAAKELFIDDIMDSGIMMRMVKVRRLN
uniref:leucine-rich repeat protein n=1 Tax=Acetatifactor sp. TaxID=1872090 RepID=UPI004056F541